MANVSEIQQAKKWIYDLLVANTDITGVVGTRISGNRADPFDAASFPYILYTFLGGPDVNGLGVNRIFSEPLFQVIVVSNASPNDGVRKVEKRIDDILGTAVYQLSGDYYFTSRREQPVDRVFTDAAGKNFYSLGGLFRLYIGRTP